MANLSTAEFSYGFWYWNDVNYTIGWLDFFTCGLITFTRSMCNVHYHKLQGEKWVHPEIGHIYTIHGLKNIIAVATDSWIKSQQHLAVSFLFLDFTQGNRIFIESHFMNARRKSTLFFFFITQRGWVAQKKNRNSDKLTQDATCFQLNKWDRQKYS